MPLDRTCRVDSAIRLVPMPLPRPLEFPIRFPSFVMRARQDFGSISPISWPYLSIIVKQDRQVDICIQENDAPSKPKGSTDGI